jgi:hypothetical protein
MCFDRDEPGLVYAEAMTASIEFLGNNGGDAGLMRAHVRILCFSREAMIQHGGRRPLIGQMLGTKHRLSR